MLSDILQTYVIPIGLRILLAIVIWIAGRWLARRARAWLTDSLQKTELTESLISLITTVAYYGILFLAALIALAALGIPVSALAAASGIIIIVLAIALKESLGNLASTVIILLFKPFKTGDVIESGGMLGVVHEIQMLSTVLSSADGRTHVLPNGVIQASGLTNYSTRGILRISLSFPISYSSDIDQAKEIVARVMTADERVLAEPAAGVSVGQLADSSVNLSALPFVKAGDFAAVQADMMERVKKEFDAAGIVIPNAQHDVYLYSQN